MPVPNTAITDSKFNALKAKLRELFELDKSDLDFGIYRIIAAKNAEVTEFLDRQLKDVVRDTLTAHGAGAIDQVQAELNQTIAELQRLNAPVATNPTVVALRARLEGAAGGAAADLEADIYNHLLAFFGRYYDEGDFISQRRYKGDTYAIPYSGEEVTLHWANKDQYYIKSGEWHKDYRFKIGNKSVHFKLVEATQEAGNNKEADDAKRRYILTSDNPIESTDSELRLRFEFRVPTEADKQRAANGVVAIFGGDFAKPTNPKKGDEREQFCADAEKRALEAMSREWKAVVSAGAATEGKPARTILGKNLDYFTARNTFDYFIHKNLGGFLRRELDFYIKNEVVRLDDLEALPGDCLQRLQGKVKTIRAVASRIIGFLASLEDFQKKMWLKKKLILNTNWLVTIERIPSALRDRVGANQAQWQEWERLGFRPAPDDAMLIDMPQWRTREYLDAPGGAKLVVDTALFDPAFKAELLASEEVLGGAATIEHATTGVLIHSENFQALTLMQPRYREQIKYVYIDPPYNTDSAPIVYKNGYRESSWVTLIADRISKSMPLLSASGVKTVAIDDTEMVKLSEILSAGAPSYRLSRITVVHNPKGSITKDFNRVHEYALFLTNEAHEACIARTMEKNDVPRKMRRWGANSLRVDRRPSFYPIYVKDGKVVRIGRVPPDEFHPTARNVECPNGEIEVWPIDQERQGDPDMVERRWNFGLDSIHDNLERIEPRLVGDSIDLFVTHEETVPKTVWTGGELDAGNYGNTLLIDILGEKRFDFPKSIRLMEKCARLVLPKSSQGEITLDYFGGSGTTGHAVINLNREEVGGGSRKFILVEMGAYFDTVLKPRITKVIYSPDWNDGKAQTHDKGISALVKYFALESYDDALNNLPAPSGTLLAATDTATHDALITYALDLQLGPHLLNLDAFRNPWGYTINAQLAGDAEMKRQRVDLVETFNYLLGMKVSAFGPVERYIAEFERAEHADALGRLRITGRLRRDPNGPFVFQRVEGELNDGNDTRVLVVWRTLTDDAEKDAAVLDAWMERHREDTRQRTEHRDYHLIYINGPVTLPQPTAEIRTVFPIEETFKARMFEDADGDAPGAGGANG